MQAVLAYSDSRLFLQDCSVADPDLGSGIRCYLTPGIRDGKKSGSESGMNITNNFSESLETVFRVKST
jgi:hypothetical protein